MIARGYLDAWVELKTYLSLVIFHFSFSILVCVANRTYLTYRAYPVHQLAKNGR
jgi:hypothetical protein